MKTIFKRIALILLSLVATALVIVAALLFYANTPAGREHLSEVATDLLDRKVVLNGGLGFRAAWPPTFFIQDLYIENFEGGQAEKMADINLFEVSISPWPLLVGDIVLPKLVLRDSEVNLERKADGDANWSLGKEKTERGNQEEVNMPVIGMLDITHSRLSYRDALQKVDIRVEAKTEGENVVLAGKGNYQNNPFRLDAVGGSLLTVQEEKPYPIDIKMNIGHTDITAKGSVQDPTNFAGMNIALTVKGANAADLFPIFGIALPPTPAYSVTGQLDYADAIWTFQNIQGKMGNSDLGGNLKWNPTLDRPKLTAKFLSQKLDFKDLGPLIGVAPENAVSEEQKAQAAKQQASPRAIPDVPLDISRLAAMDADVTLEGKSIIAPGWPLDNFFLHVTLDDRILTIDPVKFGTAKGDVAATLKVDSRQQPVYTEADFRFRRLSLGELMAGISNKIKAIEKSEGLIGGAAKLQGYGPSLHEILASSKGTVGIGMEGGKLSNLLVELAGLDVAQSLGFFIAGDKPVPVNCVLGHFEVKDGLMTSRAIVIDTDDTNIEGAGTINLGTEAMNLRFVPEPKDVSLVSLRSPVTVKGTLKSPSVGIEPGGLLARGGAAAALSIALTPIAAIVAFIDPGDGKASNCKALISAANLETRDKGEQRLIPKNSNVSKSAQEEKAGNTDRNKPASPAPLNPKSESLPPAAKRDVRNSAGND